MNTLTIIFMAFTLILTCWGGYSFDKKNSLAIALKYMSAVFFAFTFIAAAHIHNMALMLSYETLSTLFLGFMFVIFKHNTMRNKVFKMLFLIPTLIGVYILINT